MTMHMKFPYTNVIDAACVFTDKLELAANKPTRAFMRERMSYLQEEVDELDVALADGDSVEIVDGALDTAFVALTQAYLEFRQLGFSHSVSVGKVQSGFLEVCRTNMEKEMPTEPGQKIRKPEGWQPPRIADLIRSSGSGFMSEAMAQENARAELQEVVDKEQQLPDVKGAE